MSVPTFNGMTAIETHDLTEDDAWGQNSNKWTSETLYAKEGTACNMTKFNVTGIGGGADNGVGGVNGNNNIFVGWVLAIISGNIATFANGGMRVNLSSSATSIRTDYKDWYIGGGDIPWVGRGWRLVALDATRTQDATGGTFSITSIQSFGFAFNATGTNSQYPAFGIDMFYYGTGVEVTGPSLIDASNGIDINSGGTIDRNDGGSFITDGWESGDFVKIVGSTSNDGEYEITSVAASALTTGETFTQETANTSVKILCSVTLEDIYNWDTDETNNTTPMKGVVDKAPDGAYLINYPLTIGDASGSNDIYFRCTGDIAICTDQPLNTTLVNYITFAEDTGETYVQLGGTGLPGSSIIGENTIFSTGSPRGLDLDATITEVAMNGSSITNMDGGITIANDSGHTYENMTFTSCGKITLGASAVFQNNSILASQGTIALTYALSGTKTFTGLTFVSGGSGHGIELTGTANDVTLTNVGFSGYASTDGSTGDEAIYVNIASGSMTINVDGGDTPTIRTAGCSVTVSAGAVTVKVTTATASGSLIDGARVFLKASDGTGPFPYQETVTIVNSGTTATVTHTGHGLATNDKVVIEGASLAANNGVHQVTVSDTDTYTYTMSSSPGSSPTGTITSTFVALSGLTSSGSVSTSRVYSSNQPVTGWARKSSSSPYYKTGPLSGTVDSNNGFNNTAVLILDE